MYKRSKSFTSPPPSYESYLKDTDFIFLSHYKESDRTFHQKLESMFQQNYDNYEIYLFIDRDHPLELEKVHISAKKRGKHHLLTIVEIDQETPISLALIDRLKEMKKESVLIFLGENCLFTDTFSLHLLNTFYQKSPSPTLFYANFINFPTFLKNSAPLTYKKCNFKTIYTDALKRVPQNMEAKASIDQLFSSCAKTSSLKTLCIDDPFYLQVR
jgi:cellulose synthase/poly-beta-1,6-N-acetylglucosamine synthase-like glycosyltransferase